ncbi:rhamnogalacturonidase [Geofilum rubicundum]|uniref:Polygalacturonase n=1 Tax=Geofilum rubicundum JCM 15548 TaxID=1236989 RepID=A0A0E9LWI1_9BACT|nr:glycoside hydrolase family 28 protein [Geofilum rubicundum]GAO29668.1 polygalacturonase [Geofilum rubicundum JCM 15548]
MNYFKFLFTLSLLISLQSPAWAGEWHNIKDYGAQGDGKTLDTQAINSAIEAASEKGGGTIYFPPGIYPSFSIRLKSNIRLHLDMGATLLAASPDNHPGQGYDPAEPNVWGDSLEYQDFGHSHWKNSLIWGIGLENIVIEGYGRIDGHGLVKHGRRTPGLGNKAIALKECRNITIKDITIFRGGHFGILPTGVDNFTIDNVKIDSNRDGINIDACRNVRISNCQINTPNDDAIVLKSSYGLGYARATENVVINNCHVSGYDLGTMLNGTFQTTQKAAPDKGAVTGRIKLGTESNGGFKNITISNITFDHCRGFALETVDGGFMEDITITNITMRDILDSGFFIRLGRRLRGPEGIVPGKTNRILISNVTMTGVPPRYCAMVMGIPGHPVEGVTFSNIRMLADGGAPETQAQTEVPENEDGYPDPMYFGDLPAHGFYVRHAKNLTFDHIEVRLMQSDGRPAFILDDVHQSELRQIKTDKKGSHPSLIQKESSQLKIEHFEGMENSPVL